MRIFTATRQLLRQSRIPIHSHPTRCFSVATRLDVIKPFVLADIGEGIRECEIIQWFVEPNARVEEFDKICEVQSDKASVDIPSRFSGVIKKLHYEAGEMAIVGKPLVDIDVPEEVAEGEPTSAESPLSEETENTASKSSSSTSPSTVQTASENIRNTSRKEKGTHASLATPAVRHLSKELDVDINDIDGTGRDGRVTKEDIYNFQENRSSIQTSSTESGPASSSSGPQVETTVPLTQTQAHMFKTMTRSLSIPHFVYSDELDITSLVSLRQRLNSSLSSTSPQHPKLSYLPFIIKALSLALHQYPILNSRIDASTDKPILIQRSQHNIGIAIDTPTGLLVPVIKNVGALSIAAIATEISRLQAAAASSSLSPSDLKGGTITLSNIGSIGGTYLSPVIVDSQVAILGIGKIKEVPGFGADGSIVRKSVLNFSWSADHRVLDGATVARASEVVRGFVEEPERMVVQLR